MPVTDHNGDPVELPGGQVIRLDWSSQRVNAGVVVVF